jgi:hypothetical protein
MPIGHRIAMECWICSQPSSAICRFCGRSTCRQHVESLPYVLATWSQVPGEVLALVVDDGVHCGTCKPHPQPIRLDQLLVAMGEEAT